jgi:hypothetical protein
VAKASRDGRCRLGAPRAPTAAGSPEASRRAVNKAFLQDMAVAWRKYGLKALEKTAKESPAAFCKLYALIMPKEMKVEHTNSVKALSDDALSM